MSTRRIAAAALIVVVIGCGLLLFSGRRRNGAVTEQLASATRKRAFLDADLVRARQSAVAAEGQVAGLRRSLGALDSAGRVTNIDNIQIESPNAKKALRAWARLYYGELFAKLGLAHEQIERFEDLLTDHKVRQNDIVASAREQGLNPSDPSLKPLWAEEAEQFAGQVTALLGSQAVDQIQQYDQTAGARSTVSMWAGLLYDSAPLSSDQGAKVVQTLTATHGNITAALSELTGILSPSQIATVKLIDASNDAEAYLYQQKVNLNIPLTSPGVVR